MRINKWIAGQIGIGRRTADQLVTDGKVLVDGLAATIGQSITGVEKVVVDGKHIVAKTTEPTTILLHKPVGYVCSRDGQGSPTVYDLLPEKYKGLKIAGRLDKDSSGLVVMSSDGDVIQDLTHPTAHKKKIYVVTTKRPLTPDLMAILSKKGVDIGDRRLSRFEAIESLGKIRTKWSCRRGAIVRSDARSKRLITKS